VAQEIFGVEPGSEDYSHEVVLSARGKKYGLKLQNGVSSMRMIPPQRQPAPIKLEQNSWHNGRGVEVWRPNANNFYDSNNAWTATPNKLHPTLLMRWTTGMRDAEMNMPGSTSVHTWKPLYTGSGNTRYLDVAFTASASSNRGNSILIVRRKGTPGNLICEWCLNSAGNPGTVQKNVTRTISDAPDFVSYYISFNPASVLAVTSGTTYHIKIYGASSDTQNDCWEVLCDTTAAGKTSTDNSTWTASTYSPYYRITDSDTGQRLFTFNFDGGWYAVSQRSDRGNSQLWIHGCRGRATSATATTLTDTGSGQYAGAWTTNQWAGLTMRIIRGTGQGQVRTIASNTAQALTVTSAFVVTPDATSEYYIYGGSAWKEITGHGLGWVTGKPAYANGTLYFPQNDTVDIRIMQMNYANANDHGFDAENTNHNRAWFLVDSYDSSLGPLLVRANQVATGSGAPNGKAISIGRGPTSPLGTPLTFGTDVTFQTSILTGDNTLPITGLYNHQDQIYVAKEDVLYNVTGTVPVKIKYGADASPSLYNGLAACTGMDGQFYVGANHDVIMVSGSNSYSLNLNVNLPSARSGHVFDMMSRLGWLFVIINGGASGYSSIMRMGLQDHSWHEQIRGFASGRTITDMAWVALPDARSQFVFCCAGELLYQEMPLYGVRPIQDTGCAYQHEATVEFATMDLLNTDPKFFSFFALGSKNLANANTAAVYGREIALDYQLNDNVGTSSWIQGGSFGISPLDKIYLGKGSQTKIRPRLRIENNQAANPPIVENFDLSLFSRTKTFNSFLLDINANGEEEMTGEDLYNAIVDMVFTADVIETQSIFDFMHNKQMIVSVQPNVNISNLEGAEWNGVFQLYLEYLPL